MINFGGIKLIDVAWMIMAIAVGITIIYVGERVLNVRLAVFYGIETFNPRWVLALIVVPLFAGMVISFIYGLGGKMLAHFAPIPIQIYHYMHLDSMILPEGVTMLPVGYWILILIVAVEAAAVGGFIGEVVIKRTYGRRPKHLVHKRYRTKEMKESES